ncbi:MAG TPA: alpha-L-fucosidase [Candidatus Dormibacteraeota bacterium]|jgi:alpha-L-fucosidase|nr:alpha-L-fucosidase [Candidatus Dormibacteraeota bacterium]
MIPNKFFARNFVVLVGLFVASSVVSAQSTYQPSPENLKARQEFQDAKFGMFIHWGVYSVLGDGEWVLHNRKLQLHDYERLPKFFDPEKFDAKTWVALAKAAGMKYITITSRHHDGFAMFDSKMSDWNIVQRTPYGKDPLKQLADEAHRQGIKLFFYYSQLDWHNPDYFPRGRTAWDNGRPDKGNWNAYLDDYMDGQLRELLTNYGAIAGIWFDGMWDKPDADWHLDKTYALIHQLQPAALIIPNHHQAPKPGEDVQTFERDLPGRNTAGFNTTYVSDALPLESCNTLNGSWGFDIGDTKYKSPEEVEEMLVRAAGNNSNLLLNIGPLPSGEIQEEFQTRLRTVGEWLGKYGDSIYGTRGGPLAPADWGITTWKGNKIYVHVLKWNAPLLALPPIQKSISGAQELVSDAKVEVTQTGNGVVLKLPEAAKGQVDRVIVLTVN